MVPRARVPERIDRRSAEGKAGALQLPASLAGLSQEALTPAHTIILQGAVMARMVHCVKLGREAEGLDLPPYPGELGKRIYESVSKEAWQQWLKERTLVGNENRLHPRGQGA